MLQWWVRRQWMAQKSFLVRGKSPIGKFFHRRKCPRFVRFFNFSQRCYGPCFSECALGSFHIERRTGQQQKSKTKCRNLIHHNCIRLWCDSSLVLCRGDKESYKLWIEYYPNYGVLKMILVFLLEQDLNISGWKEKHGVRQPSNPFLGLR